MTTIQGIFDTNIRISELDAFDVNAVWPHNVEICVTRVPIRKRDGYSIERMTQLANKLKASMSKNGIVFLICYAPMECKSRPFEVANSMVKAGFTHIDNIIVSKSWLPGKRSENLLVNSHEYVLYFCNGDVWSLDRLPILEYLRLDGEVSCAGNSWVIETGSLEESYPIDLAELLIKMTDSLPGSVIFDPFMNARGALRAALKNGHSFYGYEVNNKKMQQYKKMIDKFKKGEEI